MKIFYDFHIHTNLSPCADSINTPNNIVNMAKIKGLDAIAITDHNTVGNVLSCMKVGEKVGITVIPGIEVTTAEEIHMVCLFYEIEDALKFGEYVKNNQTFYQNDEKIFGEEIYYDEFDNEIGREKRLLIVATNIGIYELYDKIKEYNGVCYPAHIDREANGILGILGEIPQDLGIKTVEFTLKNDKESLDKSIKNYNNYKIIFSSDAHHIGYISEQIEGKNEISIEKNTIKNILNNIH